MHFFLFTWFWYLSWLYAMHSEELDFQSITPKWKITKILLLNFQTFHNIHADFSPFLHICTIPILDLHLLSLVRKRPTLPCLPSQISNWIIPFSLPFKMKSRWNDKNISKKIYLGFLWSLHFNSALIKQLWLFETSLPTQGKLEEAF